jgi:hypothetical protein
MILKFVDRFSIVTFGSNKVFAVVKDLEVIVCAVEKEISGQKLRQQASLVVKPPKLVTYFPIKFSKRQEVIYYCLATISVRYFITVFQLVERPNLN